MENALEMFGLLSTPDVWCALWFLSVAKFRTCPKFLKNTKKPEDENVITDQLFQIPNDLHHFQIVATNLVHL